MRGYPRIGKRAERCVGIEEYRIKSEGWRIYWQQKLHEKLYQWVSVSEVEAIDLARRQMIL